MKALDSGKIENILGRHINKSITEKDYTPEETLENAQKEIEKII